MRRRALVASCVLAAVTACGGGSVAPPVGGVDAGPRVDRVVAMEASATGDMDNDGLCDLTEQERRTDPRNPDTDGDGLIDSFEVRVGTDPLSGLNPLSSDRARFTEGDTAFVTIEHVTEYEGMGEVIDAALQNRTAGIDGRHATDLVDFSVEAISANPAAFVREITGARFVGVLGRVVLEWRVTIRARADAPGVDGGMSAALGCRRAYEALLVLKREGADVVETRQLFVDVAPAQGSTAPPAWPHVSADGLCLPERCL